MAEQTNIAWCDHTFNPVLGCAKVSPGCANCYAETLAKRFGQAVWGPNAPRRMMSAAYWKKPLAWHRKAMRDGVRRRVFCGSMCDIFEDHPTVSRERAKLWRLIAETPWLDWLLLTKRPQRMVYASMPASWEFRGWPNVWLGTSIESNDHVWRAKELVAVSAAVRFISYEPALGPLDKLDLTGIHWIIYGGESGPGHRDRCRAAGVKFFFKQRSGARPGMGDLDGELIREFPA